GIVDRQAEEVRPVDHRGVDAVAVHVFEAELGAGGTQSVVLDAGAYDRAVVSHEPRPEGAHDRAVARPPSAVALLDDARPALAEPARQPLLPDVARQVPEIQVIVARVEPPADRHGGTF